MTGIGIVHPTKNSTRPQCRPYRPLGTVLCLLLATQSLPLGLARAEEKAAGGNSTKTDSTSAEGLAKHERQIPSRNKARDAEEVDIEPAPALLPQAFVPKSPSAAEARRKAVVALNTGHYRDAIKALEEAYALDQDPSLLFSLAQAYRLAGLPIKALEACSSYLRSADPDKTDHLQAELFLAEVTMISYQLQVQRELGIRSPTSAPPAATAEPKKLEIEPSVAEESPKADPKKPKLDLSPRPPSERPPVLTDTSVSATSSPEPEPVRHFYQSRTFLLVTGAVVVLAGAGLGVWAWERSRELKSPGTNLGYQAAFP
jgi:hypothetical protein